MLATNPFFIFTGKFDELGAPYMVAGSVASMAFGVQRLTHDVDLVADLNREHIERLEKLFPHPEFYCPPFDVIMIEARRRRRGHINIIHNETMFKADVYLRGEDPLNTWGFPRAERLEVGEGSMMVAPREYVIIRKLEFFREGGSEKHLRDIRGMLLKSAQFRYQEDFNHFVFERGLEEQWKRAQEYSEIR